MTSETLEDNAIRLVQDIRQNSNPNRRQAWPFFTALPNFAGKLQQAGANGLVLFNRFYQPDIDLENLEVTQTWF